jgi:hypothetical protein
MPAPIMNHPCGVATNPSEGSTTTSFLEADLNEAASAADASRDTIWQGNCAVAALQSRSNIAPIRNTIPIQYPISNCPAKKGFLQVAVSKARRAECLVFRNFAQSARFRYSTKTSGESGIALLRRASYPAHWHSAAQKVARFLPSSA